MQAILRQIRISSDKANLVASLVRNKQAKQAVDILKFTPKKAAKILKKLIESAMANAQNNFKQNKEDLYIKEIIVTQGATYKRSIPISRGRAHPIKKRTAHISVYLETRAGSAQETQKLNRQKPKVSNPKTKNIILN